MKLFKHNFIGTHCTRITLWLKQMSKKQSHYSVIHLINNFFTPDRNVSKKQNVNSDFSTGRKKLYLLNLILDFSVLYSSEYWYETFINYINYSQSHTVVICFYFCRSVFSTSPVAVHLLSFLRTNNGVAHLRIPFALHGKPVRYNWNVYWSHVFFSTKLRSQPTGQLMCSRAGIL